MKTRLYFLDNLRTFSIFLVILLHAGLVYESVLENIWIVSDPIKNGNIGLVRMYLDLFVMFTIFFISGYFIPLSVERKTNVEFLKSKVQRILLPWAIAVFTLIPFYKFIFLYSRGMPQEEWYSYFHIFQRTGSDLGFFSNNPSQNWLWFLPILFLFQVLYLALSKINFGRINISVKTGVILTFFISIIYSMIISGVDFTGWHHSGFLEFQRERLVPYFMIFLLGALCQKQQVFSSEKNTKLYIISNVVLTVSLAVFTVVALNLFFNLIDPGRNYFFVSESIDVLGYHTTAILSMFSFLYILIHVFRFNFQNSNRLMKWLNKNSYAVYVIHMAVLGVFALLMTTIPLAAFLKYLILTVLTFVGSYVLVYAYERLMQKRVLKVAGAVFIMVLFFIAAN